MSGKQHVDLHRKLLLRKRLLRFAQPGAVYVPFIGDGDLAVQLYSDRSVLGADIDPQRVAIASQRLSGRVITADCNAWPFPGDSTRFAVADFDAYTYPYASFRSFWNRAEREEIMVLFFTDTVKQAIKRMGQIHEPDGSKPDLLPDVVSGSRERSWHYNFWFSKHIWPWFVPYVKPYRVLDKMLYQRQDTVYWGVALELP